ncbi:hypothetical protein Pint_31472 [Pistacia integerrima]|uniref:Uncharacterized protein n=1 Tax=Pistacia integerrima TaxID=434235 RepID=A0ACC0XPV2_9ROSI|nr:hypothetical protein Pint_31472 [Pistacia integerrima]
MAPEPKRRKIKQPPPSGSGLSSSTDRGGHVNVSKKTSALEIQNLVTVKIWVLLIIA